MALLQLGLANVVVAELWVAQVDSSQVADMSPKVDERDVDLLNVQNLFLNVS